MHERYQPANVYIEGGDQDATYQNRDITQDGRPNDPVALVRLLSWLPFWVKKFVARRYWKKHTG